ncbi:radical SAM protein [Thermincola ferriacetica]|uniref:Radical SAM protein n=1 Tax=Thermincola ferriacetica TaxID=281456 RepID=A0A0L6W2H1_9FIRM|nr:putative DNA modification/repair radical SAM protein [Thermincola ferriacetica]KNZ69279.1 radical SAM protein [Thermincola ferriacetica]
MDTLEKMRILGGAAKYDVCAATGCSSGHSKGFQGAIRNVVCHSFLPDGRCVSLFRVLMTNACQKDCFYCPNRVQRDVPRTGFQPEELAKLFMEFYRRNYVEGLFLSSGVSYRPEKTMADMLNTVELLRFKYQYKGYIHLKILPGATYDYVEKATELATRVSINVEAPNQKRLKSLSKTKNLSDDVLVRMKWVNKLMGRNRLPAGQTTQFVVGAAGESDAEILGSVNNLYRNYGLHRAYFSAFQPIPETPLEDMAATPLLREHRLYQADILMRQYRLTFEELSFDKNGNLPLEMDPKLAVALKNIDRYPLEVNKASYYELLRVPGIGHTSAGRIIKARKSCRITEITQLKRMGVVVTRALPFLTVNGKIYNSFKHVEQLALWSDEGVDLSRVNSPLLFEGSLASAVK